MGWGRMLLLGDWGQQWDIHDQKREIEELKMRMDAGARAGDSTLKSRIAQLEKENDELRLYLAAVIKYLGHKGVLLRDDFREMVEAVDREDGSLDGGYKGRIMK